MLIRGVDAYPEGPFYASWALNITLDLDGADLTSKESEIWLEDDGTIAEINPPTERVGLSESKDKLLRFSVKSFIFR